MERINIDTLPETNVDWYADGERANAAVLNRPIKQVAGIVNTLIDAVNDQSANGEWTEQRVQQTVTAWWATEGEALVDGFRTYRTVSTSLPSGVPRQGEEWIVVQ